MTPLLRQLRGLGILDASDIHLAERLGDLAGDPSPEVRLATALLARRVSEAHVCLDLREIAGNAPQPPGGEPPPAVFPVFAEWVERLGRSPLVGGPLAPLVLDGPRLYFRRYHRYETEVAGRILARVGGAEPPLDRGLLRDGLRRLFPAGGDNPDWQRVAAAVGVLGRFSVISGGPGTGKTWTVTRILALLTEQLLGARRQPPRILLLAPTGKAAGRLRDSIRENRRHLAVEEAVRAAIPEETATIHRALGAGPGGFRHDESRPLVADAVIVDEASMVDLALIARLLAALPATARVILLGDRDQLASVEAGSVLADVCGGTGARVSRFSPRAAAVLCELTGDVVPTTDDASPLCDSIVYLRRSRRFTEHPGIGRVAAAIEGVAEGGSPEAVLDALDSAAPDAARLDPAPALAAALAPIACAGYTPTLEETRLEAKLAVFSRFRILCAHRHGPDGVTEANAVVERALGAAGRIRPFEPWYEGRPLLVTRNDAATRLFNGDTGLVVASPGGDGRKALFAPLEEEGHVETHRLLSLARLPAVETAFATTVHKSQGSEFDEVVLVLPARESPVLTRELLYTALTRARVRATVLGSASVIRTALLTPTRRSSGLADRLWRNAGIGREPRMNADEHG